MTPIDPAPDQPTGSSHRRSVPFYIVVGLMATAAHYVFTISVVELLHADPFPAWAGGFCVGALVKYWLSYVFTFRSREAHGPAAVRYIVSIALLLGANTALYALLYEVLGMHYILALVLTTGLMIPPGYVISRKWVFLRC